MHYTIVRNIFKQTNLKTKIYRKTPLANDLQKSSCTQKYGHVCNFSLKGIIHYSIVRIEKGN
jgi:hypothetical protein